MKTTALPRVTAAAILLLLPSPALAHHAEWMLERPFVQGLSMPLHGLDHMLVALATGLTAVEIGGAAIWAVPAVFSIFMLVAGLLNVHGYAAPLLEQAILASIVVLGAILVRRRPLPSGAWVLIVGALAMIQGAALIGASTAGASAGWLPRFATGCLLSSVAVLASGMALGLALQRFREASVIRYAGVAIIIAGILVYAFPSANGVVIGFLEGTR